MAGSNQSANVLVTSLLPLQWHFETLEMSGWLLVMDLHADSLFHFWGYQPHFQFHIFSQAFYVNTFLKSKSSVRPQFPRVTTAETQTHSLENEDFT